MNNNQFPILSQISFGELGRIVSTSSDEFLRQWIQKVEPRVECSNYNNDELVSILGELFTREHYPQIYKGQFENGNDPD
jgi:hypothetical protein